MTREDLIEWQKAFAKTYNKYPAEAQVAINETIKILQEPERPKGHWQHLGGDEWCCAACCHVIHTEGSWETPEAKYCEECGADMRNEQE